MSKASEINFDSLIGPTHNYAGLSYGNVASIQNKQIVSNPKLAAKQGLEKMRVLMELGVPQAVLPPQPRPNFALLRSLGFTGNDEQLLQQVAKFDPRLLAAVYSAAGMWTANMATISPSCDASDQKVHITPANLTYNLHRAQETEFSDLLLQKIFNDARHFVVHHPLPAYRDLSDEGAANHSVLCKEYGTAGLELFVYGRRGLDDVTQQTHKFPARQTMLASSSIMRQHLLTSNNSLLVQQNPQVIDAGAFHNDVVFVANKNVLLLHSQAFLEWPKLQTSIQQFFADDCHLLTIHPEHISLSEAVSTYLFNSQLVSLDQDKMAIIAPLECKDSSNVCAVLDALVAADNPIKQVIYVDCRQSMLNGGGPACLRLRMVLTAKEQAAISGNIMLNSDLYKQLLTWIDKHYRDQLSAEDFLDPSLYKEVQVALDHLTKILKLGFIYPFQQ